jgi:hypothetical protein
MSDDRAGMDANLQPEPQNLDFGERMDLKTAPITKDVVLSKHGLRSIQRKWQK